MKNIRTPTPSTKAAYPVRQTYDMSPSQVRARPQPGDEDLPEMSDYENLFEDADGHEVEHLIYDDWLEHSH